MSDYSNYTEIELLKKFNDIKSRHDYLKDDIIKSAAVIDELELKINKEIDEINEIERTYIKLIEEIDKRDAIRQTDTSNQ